MKQGKAFKRGVHLFDGKELSQDCPIKPIEAGAVMVYPLTQHIGAPAKAVVAVGDRVLKGQLIAEAEGYISAPVHSSVSGTVKAIEPREVVSGGRVDSIVIENDFQEEATDNFGAERNLEDLSADEIDEIVKNAGIVGLGGAGFPTGVKLTPKNALEIETVIINGSECEPYLTSDYRIMLERGEELIKGIKAVQKLLPAAKALIAIESNKPEAIARLDEMTKDIDGIDVMKLHTKYPQGGERQLIYAVTGKRINSKMLPADAKCLVINIATCYAIYEAVYKRIPLIHKVMTITGEGVNTPCNVDVPLGMSHSELLEKCGGAREDVCKLISGGPMMGMAISHTDVPIVKTSSAILAFTADDVAALGQSNCIHCGKCVGACPQHLIPQMLAKSVKATDFDRFDTLGGMECVECGCCTYVCPAKIPLTQMFKMGKAKLREAMQKR